MKRWSLLPDIVVAATSGVFASVVIWEFWFVPWCGLAVFMWRAYRRRVHADDRHVVGGLVAGLSIFAGILFAADRYEPAKTIYKIESRQLDLPSREVQLADLAWMTVYERERFPVRLRLSFSHSKRKQVVKLRSQNATLRELLASLEGQFGFSHKYHGCLNGTSVLTGGNAAFGLELRATATSEQQFDVDAYDELLAATRKLAED